MRTKPPPRTPSSLPAQTRACTRPDSRNTTEKTPASSHAATMSITIGRDMPLSAAALYAEALRASSSPTPRAPRSTGHNPRSSGAPEKPSQAAPAAKTRMGAAAPARPK